MIHWLVSIEIYYYVRDWSNIPYVWKMLLLLLPLPCTTTCILSNNINNNNMKLVLSLWRKKKIRLYVCMCILWIFWMSRCWRVNICYLFFDLYIMYPSVKGNERGGALMYITCTVYAQSYVCHNFISISVYTCECLVACCYLLPCELACLPACQRKYVCISESICREDLVKISPYLTQFPV